MACQKNRVMSLQTQEKLATFEGDKHVHVNLFADDHPPCQLADACKGLKTTNNTSQCGWYLYTGMNR